jgi:hypothetical protein
MDMGNLMTKKFTLVIPTRKTHAIIAREKRPHTPTHPPNGGWIIFQKIIQTHVDSFRLKTTLPQSSTTTQTQTRGRTMNDATLNAFRTIAESMNSEAADWTWTGPYMSQRMVGITETRAKQYAERHGGTASKMMSGEDYLNDLAEKLAKLKAMMAAG